MEWDVVEERAISSTVGSVILILVVIVLVATIGYTANRFTEKLPTKTPYAGSRIEFEETASGLLLKPNRVTRPLKVELNGETVRKIRKGDVGTSVLLPTSPGDKITVVASTGAGEILAQKEVHEGEAGNFIAYYTFDEGEGDRLIDRSGNKNHGTIHGAEWVTDDTGTALHFDGSDYVTIEGLEAENVENVGGFTIAVKYHIFKDTEEIQQLVEHRNMETGFEWFLETKPDNFPYKMDYAIDFGNKHIRTAKKYENENTHIAIGTYDGSTGALYFDGRLIGRKDHDETVELGDIRIGKDFESDIQHLNGRIYQIRLYYTAFDQEEIRTITRAMEKESE